MLITKNPAQKASGDGRLIFLATRSLFIFAVVTLFVLVYDLMVKS
jgi:hypothetical protein